MRTSPHGPSRSTTSTCDERPIGKQPDRLAEAVARMQRAAEVPEYPLDSSDRYATALRDIRVRLDTYASPLQAEEFVAAMRGYFLAELRKAGNSSRGVRPTLDEYAATRLSMGGGMVFPLLPAVVAGIAPAPVTTAMRRVRALTEMAATLVCWDTDIFSYAKERARTGDGYNLLDVVQAEYGCTLDEAVTIAVAMRDRIMCLSLRLRRYFAVMAAPDLDRYCGTPAAYIRGVLGWCMNTPRYRYTNGVSGAETFDSAGWAESPSDDNPEPLSIPSIGWWWEYDPAPLHSPSTSGRAGADRRR
ncbi:terpene synthase family protein [Streptomyces halobius]|uniref:Terpene synthase family protein n=1 Tax=Streptomyces halobius TaxID=2879846 RepID=A0ABY4LZR4_9ACTN|nr:terpene synthase family protein [Streptomyces halobius]UQA90712.1 terpene synthase family protein [Streptomyces halobius]